MIEITIIGVNGEKRTETVKDGSPLNLKAGETVQVTGEGLAPYQLLQKGHDLIIETAQGNILIPDFFAVTSHTTAPDTAVQPMTVDLGFYSLSSTDPITSIWPVGHLPLEPLPLLKPGDFTSQFYSSLLDALKDPDLFISEQAISEKTETNVTHNSFILNLPPIVFNEIYFINEDTALFANLLANDFDPNGDPIAIYSSFITPTAGAPVPLNSDGNFSFDPTTVPFFQALPAGGVFTFQLTYVVGDGVGGFTTGLATVHVLGVNDPPVATDNSYTTLENDTASGNLITDDTGSGTDFDIDIPSTLSVTAVTPDAGTLGSVSFTSDGSFTYVQGTIFDSLAAGATHSETFTYTLTDDQGATDTATLTITITGVNDAPVATDNGYTVAENGTVAGNLITDDTGSGTDFDVDVPSTIGVTAVTPDAGTLGSVSFTSDGSFTYAQGTLFDSLAAGATHSETFTYTLTDDMGATDTATLTMTITGVNDAPVATDNGYTVAENGTVAGNLITDDTGAGTDSDVDIPSTLSVTAVTPDAGTLGSVSFTSDGSFTYAQGTLFDSLAAGATHSETFTYTLTDDMGATDTATLTITITGVNDVPVATDNGYTVAENGTVAGNLITDDTGSGTDFDVDVPSTIGVTAVTPDAGTLGSVSFTSDGSFTYAQGTLFDSLAAGATHSETFTYTLTDDMGATDTATLTITITGVNDAPVATDNDYTVAENATVAGNLITDDTGAGTDSDVDIPSTLSVTAVTPDAGTLGSVSFTSDGSFTYVQGTLFDSLAAGATHSETFTYTLTDDLGATDTATLTITITGVNDVPVATDNGYTVAENGTVVGNLITDDTGSGTDFDVDVPSTIGVTAVTPDAGSQGVMIFSSTIKHAEEVMQCLPEGEARLVLGETTESQRAQIVEDFKQKKFRYLVNVSVLTTGFDAPHVDVIAILRPTESVSLYQQIIGRGLRLADGKKDCFVLDYAGVAHDIYSPEISDKKPTPESVIVPVPCPKCDFLNNFWGRVDEDGNITDHFGRTCKGGIQDPETFEFKPCGYRFRFKVCPSCQTENDLTARNCSQCKQTLIDADTKLKQARLSKNAHVLKPDTIELGEGYDKRGNPFLQVKYFDFDAKYLSEVHYFNSETSIKKFNINFLRSHLRRPEWDLPIASVEDALKCERFFRMPSFVIARKQGKFWRITEKIFAEEL